MVMDAKLQQEYDAHMVERLRWRFRRRFRRCSKASSWFPLPHRNVHSHDWKRRVWQGEEEEEAEEGWRKDGGRRRKDGARLEEEEKGGGGGGGGGEPAAATTTSDICLRTQLQCHHARFSKP